jgi:hypothetical protein
MQAPRNFTHPNALPGAGMPQERLARIAARRAFVELKLDFLRAIELLDEGAPNAWLVHQVRQAKEPEDLWLLRAALFAALRDDPLDGARMREQLRKTLDSVFPGTYPGSARKSFFSEFNPLPGRPPAR